MSITYQHYAICVIKCQCRKLNLLSFGEEAEEEEKELAAVKQKIKSSHDVLDDPRLLKEAIPSNELVIIFLLLVPVMMIENCCVMASKLIASFGLCKLHLS